MMTSDFRPEVEIRPFRACAMKNVQYKFSDNRACVVIRISHATYRYGVSQKEVASCMVPGTLKL